MIIHDDHRIASLVTCKIHEAKEDQRRDAKPIIIQYIKPKQRTSLCPHLSLLISASFRLRARLRSFFVIIFQTLLYHVLCSTSAKISYGPRPPPVSGSREDVLRAKQMDDRSRVRQLHTLITKGFQRMKCTDTRKFQGLTFQHTCPECAFEQRRAHDVQGSQD